ncbi:unnamed protein product [Choristocarpus tenellus]
MRGIRAMHILPLLTMLPNGTSFIDPWSRSPLVTVRTVSNSRTKGNTERQFRSRGCGPCLTNVASQEILGGWGGNTAYQGTSGVWDGHLDLALTFARQNRLDKVRVLCQNVIRMSDDWESMEQAFLRLALSEQKDKKRLAARKTFQRGTTACPSSDTLFMAWGLFESKMQDERALRIARALLRRAVALNPARHSNVLKWRMFSGGCAGGNSARSSTVPDLVDVCQPEEGCVSRAGVGTSTMFHTDQRVDIGTQILNSAKAMLMKSNGQRNPLEDTESLLSAAYKLELLSDKTNTAWGQNLGGVWRLVFTNSPACEWALLAGAGSDRQRYDFFQRLVEPIKELAPQMNEPSVPYRCEVLLVPEDLDEANSNPESWAWGLKGSAQIRGQCLRQQVAPIRRKDMKERPFSSVLPACSPKTSSTNVQHLQSPPLPLLLSGMGDVAIQQGCLESIVHQEITYIGDNIRLGRSQEGSLFVYERCQWPEI